MAERLDPRILSKLWDRPQNTELALIELALPMPGIISDLPALSNLVEQLLSANRHSPLLDSDREAAKQGD
jgi:hypothetical protein